MLTAVATGAVAVLIVAVAITRVRTLTRARRLVASRPRRALSADGIIVGAESLFLTASGDRGVLLLHGFNDTPQSVELLARGLHARGWSVAVPLLPHHGRTDDDNAQHGDATEWIDAARTQWANVRARTPRAVLAGQSMGGAIAAVLATEQAPAALVLLAPYVEMSRVTRVLAVLWRLTSLALPVVVSNPVRGLRDPAARARSLSSGMFTPRLLNELRRVVAAGRPSLARLTAPTLVVQSRRDYRIPSASAQRTFDQLAASDKSLVWLDDVGHMVAADSGRTDVGALVADWLDARVPTTGAAPITEQRASGA